MITLSIEKRGIATVKARVSAPSIERALDLCGANARVVFPVQPEPFFAPEGAAESVELPAGASERRTQIAA